MATRIMVFGAAGQVGTECVATLRHHGFDVLALTRHDVDFVNVDEVFAAVEKYRPLVVVNACAYTGVDKAEEERELADQINHRSVECLANVCEKVGALLIHLSTDYVFDGRSSTPYSEGSPVNPLGVYGETKLAGELAVTESMTRYIILRTSWVFGVHGNNFVKTMLRLAETRDQLSVVSDQCGRPSYVPHIVHVILELIQRYSAEGDVPSGIYHCSSQGELSWYEFARAIFVAAHTQGVLDNLPLVNAIPSTEYPTPAPRPMYSVLSTRKLEALLGRSMPPWQDGLNDFISRQ